MISACTKDVDGDLQGPSIAPAARPPRSAITVTAADVPGLDLTGATPMIHVDAGAQITGTVDIEVFNAHGSNTEFPVILTPTWGEHSTSWREVARSVRPGYTRHRARVSLVAPARPGTYHIVFAASAELTAAQVASGTHWRVGAPVWDNEADVAAWSPPLLNAAEKGESFRPPWLCAGATEADPPAVRPEPGPAAATVEVIVRSRATARPDAASGGR
jgi:hypothetical protein